MRLALGVSYRGAAYSGWQSQPSGNTVQDRLEAALSQFADERVQTLCAGRTDAGVHGLNQVVHLDTERARELFSWVRGVNRFLPRDIAVQWCVEVSPDFHARASAIGRRYAYVLLESAVRPAVETGCTGWTFRSLDGDAMRKAAEALVGEHDFSVFRSAECQALSPIKTIKSISVERRGSYWRFEFDATAYLHHMVRNIVGSLVAVGNGARTSGWVAELLASRRRELAAPTFAPDGLYFVGPYYDEVHRIPTHTPAMDWLP